MKRLNCLLVIVLFVTVLSSNAVRSEDTGPFNPRFELFTLPGGTLGNSVQGILQDSVGFLWFASQAGLHRYDGQNFITYRYDAGNPNSPTSDYIESIFMDSKGIIWLTHWQQGSLTKFDPDRELFTRIAHDPKDPETILDGEMSVVTEDRSGFIWIGGQQGLNRLDPETGKVKRFQHDPDNPKSISDNEVRVLYVDHQGTLWIGTGFPWETSGQDPEKGGLNRYDPETETFIRYKHDPNDPQSLANNKVRAILEDSRGNFWVGTAGDGLQRMNRETGKFNRCSFDPADPEKLTRPYISGTDPSTIPPFSHVTSIFEDRDGRIWITAVEGGLNVYDPDSGKVFHFEKENGVDKLTTNFLWQTCQTNDGTLWLATGGEGQAVFKVKEKDNAFPFFNTSDDPDNSAYNTYAIAKDKAGNVWVGLSRDNQPGKLLKVNRQKGSVTEIPFTGSKAVPGFISAISFDPSGKLWINTGDGFFTGNPETDQFQRFKPANVPDSLMKDGLFSIIHSRTGQIWFSSFDQGLTRYNPKTGEYANFRHDPDDPNSISDNIISGLFEDEQGYLWVGGGTPWFEPARPIFLDRLDPGTNTFEHFITDPAPGMAFNITHDVQGNIWFLDFLEGLYKLNPATREIKKYTSYNSLMPDGHLLFLGRTKEGKFWLGSDHHIIRFDPVTEIMSSFGETHGVKPAAGNFNGGFVAEDGELLFARKGGFHAFYPERIYQQSGGSSPDLRITGFRLLDEPITSGSTYDLKGILDKPIWHTNNIELEHDENVFSFSVACFDFYEPSANQLQFMLEGYDRGWRKDIREGETPSYINVPPGQYTFRLRGVNSFGVWNEKGISLGIKILPPWWKSIWAYVMYGMVIIGGVLTADRVQRKRIRDRERAKAREKELEQAREIEKAYHELKTTQNQLIQAEKMASLGELTAGIAHEIQNPLNFVNNFSEVNKELLEELLAELENGNPEDLKSIAADLVQNEEKISHHGKRAESIVKNMLQHSRGDSEQKEAIDINAMVEEYVNLAFHGMRARDKSFNADFKIELDKKIPSIKVVPQDIGRVLLNLINNAFYAVSSKSEAGSHDYKPEVLVSTINLGKKIEIRIKDNGPGIPAGIRDKIFQPFFTTKPTGQGTGLGLSLSYDIIKAHGGELVVESREGEGTSFFIIIPLT